MSSETPSEYMGTSELAAIMGRSVHTVRSYASRRPSALPPQSKLPGSNRSRWKRSVVAEWLLATDPIV